jgi:membrane protein YdbS with pleckstrin-like domain
LFEQFKENLSLAGETAKTGRVGLKSARAAWRNATPTRRAVWLLVPTAIVVSAVAEHFSVPWYHEVAGMLVLVVGSWTLGAMRRKLH